MVASVRTARMPTAGMSAAMRAAAGVPEMPGARRGMKEAAFMAGGMMLLPGMMHGEDRRVAAGVHRPAI